MSVQSTKDYLDPSVLSRIDNFALMAKVAVEGFLSGMHRSVFHGFGTEFLQYNNYTPGEDLKHLDWKVYARLDKLYTKVYQEETNMNCHIILDASESLRYSGSRASCSKFKYASMLAACLAYLAIRQGDNVGLIIYSDEVVDVLPPRQRAGQLHRVLQSLQNAKPGGVANHKQMFRYLENHLRNRGLVILISDMLEGEEVLPDILGRVRLMRSDSFAVQVLDPDEEDFPRAVSARFLDSESKAEVVTSPEAVAEHYNTEMAQFIDSLRSGFHASQVEYLKSLTNESLGSVLGQYLHQRGNMR